MPPIGFIVLPQMILVAIIIGCIAWKTDRRFDRFEICALLVFSVGIAWLAFDMVDYYLSVGGE